MPRVNIQRVRPGTEGSSSFLDDVQRTFDEIQRRAFGLFQERGGFGGSDLEDWIRAERDLFQVGASELVEKEKEFVLRVAVPGLEAKHLKVTALPDTLVIEGQGEHVRESKEEHTLFREFTEKKLFRRVDLPSNLDLDKVKATLDKGVLEITAPKLAPPVRKKVEIETQASPPSRRAQGQ